jgi:hypothetical protein
LSEDEPDDPRGSAEGGGERSLLRGETGRKCREILESLVEASKRMAQGKREANERLETAAAQLATVSRLLFKWMRFYLVGKEESKDRRSSLTRQIRGSSWC